MSGAEVRCSEVATLATRLHLIRPVDPYGGGGPQNKRRSAGDSWRSAAPPSRGLLGMIGADMEFTSVRILRPDEDRIGVLESCRKSMGLNGVQFAKFLGVDYSTWCRWRRAPRSMPCVLLVSMTIDPPLPVEVSDDGE